MNTEQRQFSGALVQELVNSDAWKIIEQRLNERVKALESSKENSYEPNVHFGCNKEICGIMMVARVSGEIIQDGIDASLELENNEI